MSEFKANSIDDKLNSDFNDYSTFLMAAEKSLKQCHQDCLQKRWHMAACEAHKIIVIVTRLQNWLNEELK